MKITACMGGKKIYLQIKMIIPLGGAMHGAPHGVLVWQFAV
jgi:hypothetical protein